MFSFNKRYVDVDEMAEYIQKNLAEKQNMVINKDTIITILDAELDYLTKKGIAK